MALHLGENRLLVGPLSRQWQALVFPKWRIKGQDTEFCVAHEAGGAKKMDQNAALQTQVYLWQDSHLNAQVWRCGSFWKVVFYSFPYSVDSDTQPDYVPWAMDSDMYWFLLPAWTTNEYCSVQRKSPKQEQNHNNRILEILEIFD